MHNVTPGFTRKNAAEIEQNLPKALPNAMAARSKLIKSTSVKSTQMSQRSPISVNGNDEGEEGGVEKRTVAKAIIQYQVWVGGPTDIDWKLQQRRKRISCRSQQCRL